MLSEKQQHALQIIILILGGIAGGIFLPRLHNNVSNSILIGMLLALLINVAVFPDLRKMMFEQPDERRMKRLMEEHQLGFYRSLTHPTQIPFSLSMLLFVVILILAFLFDFLNMNIDPSILQSGLLVVAFLWGLSGFLMIIRKEYIDKHGYRYRGGWAIFNGIAFLLMGWGSIVAVILAYIFHW